MAHYNYFTWRKALEEIAEEMYGVPSEEVDSLSSSTMQKHYFTDQLSPEEAAERLFYDQIPDR